MTHTIGGAQSVSSNLGERKLLRISEMSQVAFANRSSFTLYRDPYNWTSGSGEHLHISAETKRLDAHLSNSAELEPGALRLTNHYYDRLATRADKERVPIPRLSILRK